MLLRWFSGCGSLSEERLPESPTLRHEQLQWTAEWQTLEAPRGAVMYAVRFLTVGNDSDLERLLYRIFMILPPETAEQQNAFLGKTALDLFKEGTQTKLFRIPQGNDPSLQRFLPQLLSGLC